VDLRRDSISSMTTGGPVDAEHARDGEAPHVGVDDGDLLAPLGQRDGQVGGDRRLADAALARGDEQHPGLDAGSANGMARPSAWPWAAWLPAVAAGSPWSSGAAGPLLVGHHGEVEVDRSTSSRAWTALGDPAL
jgi:hypothetical protein